MSHFGVLSYKGTGHLNPLIALSKQLIARGHKVTLFQSIELEERVRQQGLDFFAIDVPNQQRKRPRTRMGEIHYRLNRISAEMEVFLQQYPSAIRASGVDTLIMGEISLTGPTIAEMLRLPYFIVSTSVPHNFGWNAPRSIAHCGSWIDRLQKHLLEVSVLRMTGPVRRSLNKHRKRIGLQPIRNSPSAYPELAHISQWPECLDLPHPKLPADFFYTGPFVDETARPFIHFPWDRLDGRPIVYASMGTTRKSDPTIFHRIAEACSPLAMQLVISLGGRRDPSMFTDLPGNPLVVPNAPQIELLKRADVVISHAGPNTVLETLMHGKPIVALPVTLDQPAVAARLVRLGVAEALSSQDCSSTNIRKAVVKVHQTPRYRRDAQALQAELESFCGLEVAADIIEESLEKHGFGSSVQHPAFCNA